MGLFTFAEKTEKPKFKKTKEDGCIVMALMEIPEALINDEKHNILLRVQEQAKIPGFRPGKAPMSLVETHYPDAIRERLLDRVAEKFVPELLKDLKLSPVSTSMIKNVEWDKSLKMEVQVEIAPRVLPKDYLAIAVSHKKYPVTGEILDAEIEKLREAHSRLEKAEEEFLGSGHYAVISYTATRGGKLLPQIKNDSELVDMSSDQLIEGLAAGLLGMKRQESKDIAVKFQGKETLLKTTLVEIKKKILPSLDEEFAKDVGVESLDELKKNLSELIQKEFSKKEEDEIREGIEKTLLKAHSIPVPPSLVEDDVERFVDGLVKQSRKALPQADIEKIRKEIRPQVKDNLRLSYIYAAIAEKEKIEASEEEYQKELEEALASLHSDAERDYRKKVLERNKAGFMRMIKERKARRLVRDKASLKEVLS